MAKTEAKSSFLLYLNYREPLSQLTDEERGRLLMALFDYAETQQLPELTGSTMIAFSFIKSQMDRDSDKWTQIKRNRSDAGRKGGQASGASRTKQNEANEANACFASQKEANEANACFASQKEASGSKTKQAKQSQANEAVNVNVDVNVKDLLPPTPLPGGQPEEPPVGGDEPGNIDPTPYKQIMALYNDICVSLPKIINIDGKRRSAVSARWRTYPKLSTFETLFRKTQASDFMKGANDRDWMADFDWIMRPTNMAKTLEGKYDNDHMKGGASNGAGGNRGHSGQNGPSKQDRPSLSGFHMAGDANKGHG